MRERGRTPLASSKHFDIQPYSRVRLIATTQTSPQNHSSEKSTGSPPKSPHHHHNTHSHGPAHLVRKYLNASRPIAPPLTRINHNRAHTSGLAESLCANLRPRLHPQTTKENTDMSPCPCLKNYFTNSTFTPPSHSCRGTHPAPRSATPRLLSWASGTPYGLRSNPCRRLAC